MASITRDHTKIKDGASYEGEARFPRKGLFSCPQQSPHIGQRAISSLLSKNKIAMPERIVTRTRSINGGTVFLISKDEGNGTHLYVECETNSGQSFLIGGATELFSNHHELVRPLKESFPQLRISGGGFLMVKPEMLFAYGTSCNYGPGDHVRATRLFKEAMSQDNES